MLEMLTVIIALSLVPFLAAGLIGLTRGAAKLVAKPKRRRRR